VLVTGGNITQVSINNFMNGLYIVELITNEEVYTNKLTISR
jgi:hypothetical protein